MVVGIKYNAGPYIDTQCFITDYVKFELGGIEFLAGDDYHFHTYDEVSYIRDVNVDSLNQHK